MKLTSKQRAYLRSLANPLRPVFQIGKGSVSVEMIEGIADCFNNHELIKVSILQNCDDDPKLLAYEVAEGTDSTVVQVIGKKFTLYKPFKEDPQIELPR